MDGSTIWCWQWAVQLCEQFVRVKVCRCYSTCGTHPRLLFMNTLLCIGGKEEYNKGTQCLMHSAFRFSVLLSCVSQCVNALPASHRVIFCVHHFFLPASRSSSCSSPCLSHHPASHHLINEVLVHHQVVGCDADLPRIRHLAEENAVGCHLQVGAAVHVDGVLAAQLKSHRGQVLRGAQSDQTADGGTACQRGAWSEWDGKEGGREGEGREGGRYERTDRLAGRGTGDSSMLECMIASAI